MGFDTREEVVEFRDKGGEKVRLSGGESGRREELEVLEAIG